MNKPKTKTRKFDFRVLQEKDNNWTTEIVRRVTSKKNHVSKSKSGFNSEAEASQWGELEVEGFIKNLADKNKRQTR